MVQCGIGAYMKNTSELAEESCFYAISRTARSSRKDAMRGPLCKVNLGGIAEDDLSSHVEG